jgi:hypothetical protein
MFIAMGLHPGISLRLEAKRKTADKANAVAHLRSASSKKTPRARNISPLLGRKRNDVLLHVQLKPQVKWGAVSLPKAHDHNSCHQLLPTDREAGWSTKPHRMMLPPLNALSPFP